MGRVWLGNRSVFLFGIVNCSGIVGTKWPEMLELSTYIGIERWDFSFN